MVCIGITGAYGRMGQELIKTVLNHPTCTLGKAFTRSYDTNKKHPSHILTHENVHYIALSNVETMHQHIQEIDTIIDFTHPTQTMALLPLCVQYRKKMVIGTTGFSSAEIEKIKQSTTKIPIVLSPNMSISVNIVFKLLQTASMYFNQNTNTDIEIIEKHHRNKLDAPSGTALKMGEIIASATQRSLETCAVYGRQGSEKTARSYDTIGFSAVRAGHIIGEHNVLFANEEGEIEITHRSAGRSSYASGAVRAAVWLQQQSPQLYDIHDMIQQS